MMASLKVIGRLWLLLILIGVSSSYPMKKDFQDVPDSGFTDTSAASSQVSQNTQPKLARTIQHGTQISPTPALYNTNAFAAPIYLAYDGFAPDSSFQASPVEDTWAIQPPGPFSGGTSSGNLRFVSRPPPGLGYRRPSVPLQSPFRSGESSSVEKVYDRGNYNSETEERGLMYPHGPIQAPTRYPVSSFLKSGPPVGGVWFGYPNDYMMLQGPIPSKWNPPMILKG